MPPVLDTHRPTKMQRKRLSSVTSSAAIIGGNDDLLMEILLFLPVKPFVRFRLVSKRWRSLIDDEFFHNLHWVNRRRRRPHHQFILHTAAPLNLLICDLTAKTLRPLPPPSKYRHVRVLQSSHGLLLLDCRKSPRGYKDVVVYNPTTSKQSILLHLPGQDFSRFCLIYDFPSTSYGYTVFRLIANSVNYTQINVYDSRTQNWETKGKFNGTLHRFPQGVLCNDGLYFIRFRSSSSRFSPDGVISSVATPPRFRRSARQKKYVVESNGHLHYLVLSLKKNKTVLGVYEMIDDKCWVMSNRVDSDRPLSATFGVEEIEVLGFVRGERLNDSILVYHVIGKIMIYRFCDGVSEEIVDFSKESYCQDGVLQFEFKYSHHFIESLASVKRDI